jgi:serine protease Do
MLVAAERPGEKAELTIKRDGRTKGFKIKLGERPTDLSTRYAARQRSAPTQELPERLGLELASLSPRMAAELGYDDVDEGVIVQGIRRGSPAADKNIRRGDLVLEVNRQDVESIDEVTDILEGVGEDEPVLLLLRRGQTTFYTAVKMPQAEQ